MGTALLAWGMQSVLQMRPTTQIRERIVRVKRDDGLVGQRVAIFVQAAFFQAINELDFIGLIVELGASLDVLFAVIVIGVLTGRMRSKFGGADLDALHELRD